MSSATLAVLALLAVCAGDSSFNTARHARASDYVVDAISSCMELAADASLTPSICERLNNAGTCLEEKMGHFLNPDPLEYIQVGVTEAGSAVVHPPRTIPCLVCGCCSSCARAAQVAAVLSSYFVTANLSGCGTLPFMASLTSETDIETLLSFVNVSAYATQAVPLGNPWSRCGNGVDVVMWYCTVHHCQLPSPDLLLSSGRRAVAACCMQR